MNGVVILPPGIFSVEDRREEAQISVGKVNVCFFERANCHNEEHRSHPKRAEPVERRFFDFEVDVNSVDRGGSAIKVEDARVKLVLLGLRLVRVERPRITVVHLQKNNATTGCDT